MSLSLCLCLCLSLNLCFEFEIEIEFDFEFKFEIEFSNKYHNLSQITWTVISLKAFIATAEPNEKITQTIIAARSFSPRTRYT